ncbi:hypothetical protein D3C87_1870380 [compost metagenome]
MQDVDGFSKLCDVYHAKRTRLFPKPDFADAGSDRCHGLPVVRLQAALYLIYLMPRVASCMQWKGPQFVKCRTQKGDEFEDSHAAIIQIFV